MKYNLLILIFSILLTINGLAQRIPESAEIEKDNLFNGILLTLSDADMRESNIIVIQDTNNIELALADLLVDGQKFWIKKSREDVQIQGTIHWYYDSTTNILVIKLSKNQDINSLELRVVPVNTMSSELTLDVFRAVGEPVRGLENLQKISEYNIEIK
jgi:hypothetical protein